MLFIYRNINTNDRKKNYIYIWNSEKLEWIREEAVKEPKCKRRQIFDIRYRRLLGVGTPKEAEGEENNANTLFLLPFCLFL